MSLLEAFAVLLNFTDNFYLQGKPYKPTKDDLMQLLSSSQENVFLGDKEGLIHQYNVKALYVLPLFDVYSFGEGTRNAMLHSITHVIHHPRLRPNNFRLNQISPAATAVCTWVRAAFFYAKKATEIYPVVKRVLAQLVVLEKLRDSLESEKRALAEQQRKVDEARQQIADQLARIEELRKREDELQIVITGIEQLDRDENVPIEKQHVKRPQTFRPPSAAPAAAGGGGGGRPTGKSEGDLLASDSGGDKTNDGDNTKEKSRKSVETTPSAAAIAPTPQVNHRQVFEETHDENAEAKQAQRRQKEQVLEQILTNAELVQEFGVLKKEIRKVIDCCDGKVALQDFPDAFQRVMLKPFDPNVYGVKKLRTLLALMDDTCVVVDPEKEGDLESVKLPIELDDVPMLPRLACMCRFCPGVSYATKSELTIHEATKWHFWNLEARRQGEKPTKWTLASTFWSEAYDSADGSICYVNRMTGEVLRSVEPPREMQASDVMLELLRDEEEPLAVASPDLVEAGIDEQGHQGPDPLWFPSLSDDSNDETFGMDQVSAFEFNSESGSRSCATADQNQISQELPHLEEEGDPWEEVADDAGNVYFYNQNTGEASWTRPTEEAQPAQAAAVEHL